MNEDIKQLYDEREALIKRQTAIWKKYKEGDVILEADGKELEELEPKIAELTKKINELLDAEIKRLTDSRDKPPEMMNEGQKNTLIFLLSDPDPKQVRKDLVYLQELSCQPKEVQGYDKLKPEEQAELNKQLVASNYLLALALEVLAADSGIAPAYEVLPSSPHLYLFNEVMTANGKRRQIKTTENGRRTSDRHKGIKYTPTATADGYSVTQTHERNGESVTITLQHADQLQGKGVKKCYAFLLAQSNKQNFSPVIGFSLQEVVDRGMYSSIESARRMLKNSLDTLQSIQISGTVKKGKRATEQQAGILFYHYTIQNNYVTVYVNENINIEFIASYFALLPMFSYGLNDSNAFDICEYVFLQARQNTKAIREKGSFNISFKKIQEILSLPLAEDMAGKKFKPKQYVIDPILKAIDEISTKALEAGNVDFTLEPCYNADYKNLDEFLEGYIRVTLTGEIADGLTALADKQDAKIAAAVAYRKKLEAAKKAKEQK